MQEYLGPDASETAKFVLLVDRLFDCLNTSSFAGQNVKRKPDLPPHTSSDDPRFHVNAEPFSLAVIATIAVHISNKNTDRTDMNS